MKLTNPLAAMDTTVIERLMFQQIRKITVPPDAPVRITIIR